MPDATLICLNNDINIKKINSSSDAFAFKQLQDASVNFNMHFRWLKIITKRKTIDCIYTTRKCNFRIPVLDNLDCLIYL